MKLYVRSKLPPPLSTAKIKKLASFVLKEAKGISFERRAELPLVFTGDGEVRKLNKFYRKKDKTTDVLSFPFLEGKKSPSLPGGALPLGDVVLSLPQTKRQAAEGGRSYRSEAALLLIHGILHLLGYDHVTKAQEKRMFGLQDKLLKKFEG